MSFLVITTALDLMVHAFCWVRLAYITQHDDHPSFGEAIRREPAAIALIAYTFCAFGWGPPALLLSCCVMLAVDQLSE